MNPNIEKLLNLIKDMIYDKMINEEKEIDDVIDEFSKLSIFNNNPLTEEDKKIARNRIHAEYLIKLDLGNALISHEHKKWFKERKKDLNMYYWNRYKKYLIKDRKFSVKVVQAMDEVSDELTDFLGDPTFDGEFKRRGLIIGDVQSGKTANYTGLICKAVDAGYKVIVLLTGTIEELRKQTQGRLDEGFTGRDSDAMQNQKQDIIIGVGKYNGELEPVSFTSKGEDFNTRFANNLNLSLNSLKQPVIFVIKKNVTVLDRLNQWLRIFNLDENTRLIKNSLLMIDDEADNASINTNKPENDPTRTNAEIRKMLKLFQKSSYVGFTATPFANIFIDPDTDEEMENEDLFPKDYIYALDAPSNYIGAKNIFGEDAKYSKMIETIDDCEDFFPQKHKSDYKIIGIPHTLKKAINQFLLANAIRDLRGNQKEHRSMLINISRFIKVQEQIKNEVNNYFLDIKNSVKLYSKLERNNALKDRNIKFLYDTYLDTYGEIEFTWEQIQNVLDEAISPIEIKLVNTGNKNALKYKDNEENGLRVIAVGGLSLSRGLTLEGLVTSYFYRNSKMYDTVMQMGRWFGYRPNYADLCKIWMSEESKEWYKYISDATEELKNDIKRMGELGKTPLEFGLRVRNDNVCDEAMLMVTARNKMRTAQNYDKTVSLSKKVLETSRLYNDNTKNEINLIALNNLIKAIQLNEIPCEKQGSSLGYRNVNKKMIIDFLENYEISYANHFMDNRTIINFINRYEGKELEKWDIVFINGSSLEKAFEIEKGKRIKCVTRSCMFRGDENRIIQLSKQRNRLGSITDSIFGITEQEISDLKQKYVEKYPEKVGKEMPQIEYFGMKRNPLLMIYLIDLNIDEKDDKKLNLNKRKPVVGISIGIPLLENKETQFVHYKINLIALRQLEEFNNTIDEEEEEIND